MRRRLRTSSTNTSSESFLPYSPIQSVGASLLISFLLLNISMRKLSRDMHVQRESCQRSVNFNKRVVNFFSKLQQQSCQKSQFPRESCQKEMKKAPHSVPFSTSAVGTSTTGVVFQRPELSIDNVRTQFLREFYKYL